MSDIADAIDTIDTFARNMGTLVLELPETNERVENISDLCESERVWENYYGSGNMWDWLEEQFLNNLQRLITPFTNSSSNGGLPPAMPGS